MSQMPPPHLRLINANLAASIRFVDYTGLGVDLSSEQYYTGGIGGKCPYANRYQQKNDSLAVRHASFRVPFLFHS